MAARPVPATMVADGVTWFPAELPQQLAGVGLGGRGDRADEAVVGAEEHRPSLTEGEDMMMASLATVKRVSPVGMSMAWSRPSQLVL